MNFIQEDGYFFTDYIREVKERGYTGKCYVPHDISVKSFESGRTSIQTLVSAKLNSASRSASIALDGIEPAPRDCQLGGVDPVGNAVHGANAQTAVI
jgi:hypothetical protein